MLLLLKQRFLLSWLGTLVFLLPRLLNNLAYQSLNFESLERTWWMLFQKRAVHTKFDNYIFIKVISIYLMTLVIGGEHLHRLCLMCNPIGYCVIKFMHFIQLNIWIELN